MKTPILKRFILLSLLLIISACYFLPSGDVDPTGRWMLSETKVTIKYLFVPFSESLVYDPVIDEYYDAMLVDISDSTYTVHLNLSGTNYGSKPIDIELGTDSIKFFAMDQSDSLEQQDSISFRTKINWRGELVFSIAVKEENVELILETIHKPYSGSFPPPSWLHDIEADDYEPDDTLLTATHLTNCSTEYHTLTAQDLDYFSFDADSGNTYTFKLMAYRDIQQELIHPDSLDTLAYDMDDDDKLFNNDNLVESALQWDCKTSGKYYTKVTMEDTLQSAYYKYNMSEKETASLNKMTDNSPERQEALKKANEVLRNYLPTAVLRSLNKTESK